MAKKRKLTAEEIEIWDLIEETADLLLIGTEKERIAMKAKLEKVLKKHDMKN